MTPGPGEPPLEAIGAVAPAGGPEAPVSSGPTPAAVPFGEAVRAWVRIAIHSFGGPAGQISVIHRVVVAEKGWVSERSFLHALGYCMLLPGPEAQQLVTYMGWRLHGVRGGLAAGGLFVVPGFLSILLLSVVYVRFGQTALVEAAFYGLKPAVIAIVLQAMLRIGRRALVTRFSVVVALAAFTAMLALAVPFPLIVLAAALVGVAALRPSTGASPPVAGGPGRLTRADARRAAGTAAVWLAVWWIPVAALLVFLGAGHVLTLEATFFSRAAVVTFGGAYAVLSYVAQQAVDVYAWLTPREMLDGLGLAETTPGPLIQVVQFVGFLGAYRNPGHLEPLTMGILGSVVTTWVTFAPCFLFIFVGAPFIEGIQHRPRLQGALAGITAAVLGAVGQLAVWFTVHTVFRATRTLSAGPVSLDVPVWSAFDPGAAAIGLLAVVLVLRFRLNMMAVLATGIAAGLLLRL